MPRREQDPLSCRCGWRLSQHEPYQVRVEPGRYPWGDKLVFSCPRCGKVKERRPNIPIWTSR